MGTPRRVAAMNAYDSIERGAADEVERRRRRTFTLTQLLVACVAVCVCSIAATTAVHRLSQEPLPSAALPPLVAPPAPRDHHARDQGLGSRDRNPFDKCDRRIQT